MKKIFLPIIALLLTTHLSHSAAPHQEDSMSREMVPLLEIVAELSENTDNAEAALQDHRKNDQDRIQCDYISGLIQQRMLLICVEKPRVADLPIDDSAWTAVQRQQSLHALDEAINIINQKIVIALGVDTRSAQSAHTSNNRTRQQGLINCLCCLSCCF